MVGIFVCAKAVPCDKFKNCPGHPEGIQGLFCAREGFRAPVLLA